MRTEPEQVFADTPAMSKLRNESRSSQSDSSATSVECEVIHGGELGWESEFVNESAPSEGQETLSEDGVSLDSGEPDSEPAMMQASESLVWQNEWLAASTGASEGAHADSAATGTAPLEALVFYPAGVEGPQVMSGAGENMEGPVNTSISVVEDGVVDAIAADESESATFATTGTSSDSTVALLAGHVQGDQSTETESTDVVETPWERQSSAGYSSSGSSNHDQGTTTDSEAVTRDTNGLVHGSDRGLGPGGAGATFEQQVQASATGVSTKDGIAAEGEEMVKVLSDESSANIQSENTVSTISTVQAAATETETVLAKNPLQSVSDQILASLQACVTRGDKQVLVRLDPPELGIVIVRFQEQDGSITGVLEFSKDQTREEVQQALPQVVRDLQEAGVLIRRLEAVVSDQAEREMGRDPSGQDAWAHQEGSDQQAAQSRESSARQGSTLAATSGDSLGHKEVSPLQIGRTGGRINMLI